MNNMNVLRYFISKLWRYFDIYTNVKGSTEDFVQTAGKSGQL